MVSEVADRVEPAAGRFVSIRRWFAGAVRAQEGRAFLWTPIVMVFGIWTYFALEEEPALLAAAAFGVVALGLFWLGRGRAWLILLAILATGFVLASFATGRCPVAELEAYLEERAVAFLERPEALALH